MDSEKYFAPIAALDLDPIKIKLMHEESGECGSLAHADAVEFPVPTATPASPGIAVETASFDAPGRADAAMFYSVRPTLARAP